MVENECIYIYPYTNKVRYCTLTMDSLVWAMSVMTPSEMMSRMKYCEPSVTAEAYLPSRKQRGQRSAGLRGGAGSGSKPIGAATDEGTSPTGQHQSQPHPRHTRKSNFISRGQ